MNAGQTYAFLTPIGPMTAEEKAGALTSLMPGGTLGAGEAPTPLLRETAGILPSACTSGHAVAAPGLGCAFDDPIW